MDSNSAPTRGDTGSALAVRESALPDALSLLDALGVTLPAGLLPSGTSTPRVGAPTKYTVEYVAPYLAELVKGRPRKHACTIARLSDTLVSEWRTAGRAGDVQFVGFADAEEQAQAARVATLIDDIERKGATAWQASWALLKAADPAHFAEQSTRTVRHEGSALTVNLVQVTGPDLVGVMRILQQAGALPSGDVIEGQVVSTEGDSE